MKITDEMIKALTDVRFSEVDAIFAINAAYPLILEEAAKVCEGQPHFSNKDMCAQAIRAMINDEGE